MKTNGVIVTNGNGYHHPKEQFEPMLEKSATKSKRKKRCVHCTKFRWALCACFTLLLIGSAVGVYFFMFAPSYSDGDSGEISIPDIDLSGDDYDDDDYYGDSTEDDNDNEDLVVSPTASVDTNATVSSNITSNVSDSTNIISTESTDGKDKVPVAPDTVLPTTPTPRPRTRKPAKFILENLPHVVLQNTYPVSVDQLHETVAGDNTTYVRHWYETHDAINFNIEKWGKGEGKWEGHDFRRIDYTQKMQSVLLPSGKFQVNVDEVRYTGYRKGSRYGIDLFNYATGIMYGDTFYTLARYNLRRITPHESELIVSYDVKFTSPPGWFIKGQITGNAKTEITQVYTDMDADLQKLFPRD